MLRVQIPVQSPIPVIFSRLSRTISNMCEHVNICVCEQTPTRCYPDLIFLLLFRGHV